MLRHVVLLSVIAANTCLAGADAGTGGAAQRGLAAIVGTFDCVTHDSDGVVWRFHSVNRPWGTWVRADTTFMPQNNQPADSASTFVGFDAKAKRWNIVSIDEDGSYYTRYSSSREFDGSRWIDGFPADGARALIRVRDMRQYTFDLTTIARNGRAEISSTVCTREE